MILGDRGRIYVSLLAETDKGEDYKDLIKNSEEFLSVYENYILHARYYQKEQPPRLKYNLIDNRELEANQKDSNSHWISLQKPRWMIDSKFNKMVQDFANAEWVFDGNNQPGREASPTINVLDANPDKKLLKVDKKPQSGMVSLPPQLYVLERQLRALRALINNPRKEYLPILQIIAKKYDTPQRLKDFIPVQIPEDEWEILNEDPFKENEAIGTSLQKEFVQNALGCPDFTILNGPPGSGKTEAICELILQAAKRGQKILLCAPTHTAVDNVLAKIGIHEEITAVRISARQEKVDERLLDHHIDKIREAEKKKIQHHIDNYKPERSESQDYFLSAVKTDNEVVTQIILNSANLVCGTNVGILYHPLIKKMQDSVEPVYDLLIMDESSRATFHEWLVPALYAKKWVIVGDPLQLPPYVDEKELAATILDSIEKIAKETPDFPLYNDMREVCVDVALCKWVNRPILIANNNRQNFHVYKKQAKFFNIPLLDLDKLGNIPAIKPEESAIIFIDAKNLPKFMDELINLVVYARGKDLDESFLKGIEKNGNKSPDETNLEMALAWRKERLFQLRHYRNEENGAGETCKRYLQQIDDLLPHWNDEALQQMRTAIDQSGLVPLPSIIELLLDGYQGDYPYGENTLVKGFPEEGYQERIRILKYQHRSHDAIIKYAREKIYEKQGVICLESPENISKIRESELTLEHYKNHALWVHYTEAIENKSSDANKYINEAEANAIIQELKCVISELQKKTPPYPNNSWEIAVLTFYNDQKDLLTKRIVNELPVKKGISFFPVKDSAINITINTVDGFQGHEADIVFLSVVNHDRIGFLDSLNRLNVALTRARHYMVIFGNRPYFFKQDKSPVMQELAKGPYYISYSPERVS